VGTVAENHHVLAQKFQRHLSLTAQQADEKIGERTVSKPETTQANIRFFPRSTGIAILSHYAPVKKECNWLLGASNYCMQLLVAPRRKDVDRVHSKGI
jgi:hypothetical protein